jgi:acyl-[acyl-carrier-protein]-phospholipid O-acyltransferase/long-chain-fatty-acid--[acyl-carrier-protein] ligase
MTMLPQSPANLHRHRGFLALLLAQVLGAFNDNFFKMIVSLLVVDTAVSGQRGGYLSLVGVVFLVPYLLFSGYAGYVADIFDKRQVLIAIKASEIAIMAMALAALICGRIDLMLAVLFLLATQASFFSPAKYGILLEMLPGVALARANGILESGRYFATILGTVLGGVVLAHLRARPSVIGGLLLAIAGAGFLASLHISIVPRSGAAKRFRLNPWGEIANGLSRLAEDRSLMWIVGTITYFEFLGALTLLDMILVAKEVMGVDDAWTSLLGAFIGCGIALGSVAAGHLARSQSEIGLVPFGAAGVALGIIVLSAATGSYATTAIAMTFIGLAGGFVVVPLNAALQRRARGTERGQIVSTNNFLNMAAILLSSGALWLLRDLLEIGPARILLLAGLATCAATICALRYFPNLGLSAFRSVLIMAFVDVDPAARVPTACADGDPVSKERRDREKPFFRRCQPQRRAPHGDEHP